MRTTKPFLKTTTALVLMASLALPAAAQSLSGMKQKEIMDGALAGTVDLGFDTSGMTRGQIRSRIVEVASQCATGEAGDGVDCAIVAQIPQKLTQAKGEDTAAAKAATPSEAPAADRAEAPDAAPADAPAAQAEASEPAQPAAEQAADQADPSEKATKKQKQADAKAEKKAAKKEQQAEAKAKKAEKAAEDTPSEDDLAKALAAQEAADQSAGAADSSEPVAGPETTAQDADPAPETTAEAPAETPETTAEAPTDTPEATADAQTDTPAKADSEAVTTTDAQTGETRTETPEQTAETEAAPLDEADREAAAAGPKEVTDQQQADAVARIAERLGLGAAAAAAAGNGEEADAEVVEEEVTAEDVRSSDEDFDTRIGENAGETKKKNEKKASKDDDDDRGLTDAQKTALVGLGALALTQFLGNDAKVVENSGDRVVVEEGGQYRVLRNDDVLLRRPGSDVTTYRYDDGSTRSVVEYDDGNVVETVKAADGRVLRRTRTLPDGQSIVLFDDTQAETEVVVNELPQASETPRRMNFQEVDEAELAAALAAESGTAVDRTFSLNQIRNIDAVRHLVPEVSVDSINFETGSAAIRPEEARALAALGNAMKQVIAESPGEVFLIEGHTDAVGSWTYNLTLSDRRAESVALALTEYFDVPPENMVLQGYGEGDLAVQSDAAERENRRAAVRRITPLLQGS
ncbi:OmpA family protein [Salipiger thiooxidans]|uniref:OmpA family protein n=1 Tax=Salipiger thiooxidans TaxID=282683 RepID=UPI001CD4BB98|nr:OmpA family protein [Salipiger thiooxidans]MCA0848393.1 OmpA family protein [Salipiger thiooxidans]